MKHQGKVHRGWLGVGIAPIPQSLRAHLPNLQGAGMQVIKVVSGSPADKGGLQKWDILVSFAGKKVKNLSQFRQLVESASGTVDIELIRGLKTIHTQVTLGHK